LATSSTLKRRLNQVFHRPEFPIILAPFLLLAPVWLTGKALFWGTPSTQFVPWWVEAARQLQAGHIPLWNPGLGMGAPLLANYQSALFYPPTWLYIILYRIGGTPTLAWGMAPLVAAHLAWAGLGTARLVRSLGLGGLAQVVSGLAYGLSGYLVARSAFLSINAAAAWLPWILYGLVLVLRTKSPQSSSYFKPKSVWLTLLAFLFAVQLLAGHAQTAWYTLILSVLWVFFWSLTGSGIADAGRHDGNTSQATVRLRRLFWAGGLLGLAVFFGVLLAAAQLLPTAEYLLQSQRAGSVEYEFAMTYSFWPWRALTLLAPGLFGSPASGDYWGYANYWEDAVYIGLLPFLLALLALFTRGRRIRFIDDRMPRLVGFLLGILLVAFLLALGKNTPLFPWLYRYIPTFDMFQAPTRISLLAVFCLALLAGIGTESWRRPTGRGLYWVRLGTAAALAVTIGAGLAAAFARDYFSQVEPSTIRAVALTGLWGLGAGILTLTAPLATNSPAHRSLTTPWAWAVVLWVASDLLIASWGLNPGIDLNFYRFPSPTSAQVRVAAGSGRLYLPKEEETRLKFDRFFRFQSYDLLDPQRDWVALRAALLPNINLLDQIASANNFDPLQPGRYALWMQALEGASAQTQQHMLDLMGVNVVEWEAASQPSGVRFEPRQGFPVVRWSSCGFSARDANQALELIMMDRPASPGGIILEAGSSSASLDCSGDAQPGIQILRQNPDHLELLVDTSQSGYLVVAEVWYPGWQARLDGQAVDLLHADYLFRTIKVPAGKHSVTISYRPAAFYLGVVLSGAAWLVFGLVLWRGVLSRSRL
jgi:hypothetical protein